MDESWRILPHNYTCLARLSLPFSDSFSSEENVTVYIGTGNRSNAGLQKAHPATEDCCSIRRHRRRTRYRAPLQHKLRCGNPSSEQSPQVCARTVAETDSFLDYPDLELSNNLAENSMRPVVLGRKNWIHIGSSQARPKVAAILYIVESCRRMKIPLREYLGRPCCRAWKTCPSKNSLNLDGAAPVTTNSRFVNLAFALTLAFPPQAGDSRQPCWRCRDETERNRFTFGGATCTRRPELRLVSRDAIVLLTEVWRSGQLEAGGGYRHCSKKRGQMLCRPSARFHNRSEQESY